MCELVHCVLAYTTSRTNALRERGGGVRGRERKGERTSGVAVIARRPAWRQPGKLQARPYFVLSCCFSTRRKEMSEQTRHATPNLLISIHILWLLISSLLHSLSTSFAPFPFGPSMLHLVLYLSIYIFLSFTFIYVTPSPLLQLFSSFLPNSRRPPPSFCPFLVSLSVSFYPHSFFLLYLFFPPFHLPPNILP